MNSTSLPEWMQWVFSGIGVAGIGYIVNFYRRKSGRSEAKQTAKAENGATSINVGGNLSGGVTVETRSKSENFAVTGFLEAAQRFKLATAKLFAEMEKGGAEDKLAGFSRYDDLQGEISGKYLATRHSLDQDLYLRSEDAWSALLAASNKRKQHSSSDWILANMDEAMEIRRQYESAFDEFFRTACDVFEIQARRNVK